MNIVLVHGILGFDRIGPLNYFNGIADHLHQRFGANVFAPALDPTAGTEKRSGMLRRKIEDALSKGGLNPAEPIHLIAHSMGGLDSRRMISQDRFITTGTASAPVQTLATIGTPHYGSPIADLVAGKLVPKVPLLEWVLQAAAGKLGDVLAHFKVSLDGLHDLTTEAAAGFNRQFPDNKDVKYLSYAGKGRGGLFGTSRFFLPFYEFIHLCNGEDNDGLVSIPSATWTGFDPAAWPSDHADEIGHDLDEPWNKLDQATSDRYEAIVAKF